MTFLTLAMLTVLCLFIPIAMPVAGIGIVILLYWYPYHTAALLGALLLGWVIFLYLKRRIRNAHS